MSHENQWVYQKHLLTEQNPNFAFVSRPCHWFTSPVGLSLVEFVFAMSDRGE